uniref:Uncharacterized protein n=1 Tax=Arundo donax TaxID=35708 RepID=A0A0A8ZCZ1_ARUDO
MNPRWIWRNSNHARLKIQQATKLILAN